MRHVVNYGIVALVALAFTAAPAGEETLSVILTLLSIAFFTLIAVFGYSLYIRYRYEIETLSERQRLVLYGSVGLAFLALCATARLIDAGGLGFGLWLALLGLCSYGVYWVWTQYRSYG
jgi:hypothetical protein